MAVVKVNNSRNVVGAIRYLLEEESHDGVHARVGAVSSQNMTVAGARWEAVDTLKRFGKWNTGHVQAQLIIQSFGTDELHPDNQDDLERANAAGKELARELFGEDRQFLVVTQADNGKVHNHIVCVSPDLKTGRSLRGAVTGFKRTKQVSDEVLERHEIRNVNSEIDHTYTDRKTMGDIKKAEKGEYVWKDDLKKRIEQALEDENVVDEATFQSKMFTQCGVNVVFRGKGLSYKFLDEDGKQRTIRAHKLGSIYSREGLDYGFTDNKRKQQEREQQQQQRDLNTGLSVELNVSDINVSDIKFTPRIARPHRNRDEPASREPIVDSKESAEDGGRNEQLAPAAATSRHLIRSIEENNERDEREQREKKRRLERQRAEQAAEADRVRRKLNTGAREFKSRTDRSRAEGLEF